MKTINQLLAGSFGIVWFVLSGGVAIAETTPTATELVGKVTSVSQLADVQPTDWAFQALQSLVERYGCIEGYPDRTFRGDRALTRYEFAAGLNACLDRINELIASSTEGYLSNENLATLQRLQQEFATELAALRGRIDALEARSRELEANQFSTTTKLIGQVIIAVNDGGFNGDSIIDPRGVEIADSDPNTAIIYRTALDFSTSFFGTDLLLLRIDTGSGGPNDNTAAILEPNFGSGLDYSSKPPTNGNFAIARLHYTFKPFQNFTVSFGPDIKTTDYLDRNSYAYLSFRDFSTEALVNNYILFPINGPSAGAAIAWNPGGGAFKLRALYTAADADNPGKHEFVKGVSRFIRLLYPDGGGEGGFFGDSYQSMVELEYSPSKNFAVRLQYSGGETFDHRFDVFGANVEFTLTKGVGIFGRYGYGSYDNTVFGDLNPQYWMAGVGFRDFLAVGSLAGIAAGQPFIESDLGNATQTNFEAFYSLPLSDNISITPLIQVVTNPGNQEDNGTIFVGTLRTVFSF